MLAHEKLHVYAKALKVPRRHLLSVQVGTKGMRWSIAFPELLDRIAAMLTRIEQAPTNDREKMSKLHAQIEYR